MGRITKTSGALGFAQACLGPLGEYIRTQALGRIVNESLTAALEQLNEQILTSGKEAILEVRPNE